MRLFVIAVVDYPLSKVVGGNRGHYPSVYRKVASSITQMMYLLVAMLVKITNIRGDVVTDVRCFDQQWLRLPNGESKTVRLNSRYMMYHSVTYKVKGKERMEVLPSLAGVKFTCLLAKKP